MTPRKPTRAAGLGVSDEEYARLLASQDGGCAICAATPKTRRLHVDHDHRTGDVRGLLCHRCNRYLPAWVTVGWLRGAIEYLERHAGRPTQAELDALRESLVSARGEGLSSPPVRVEQAARETGTR